MGIFNRRRNKAGETVLNREDNTVAGLFSRLYEEAFNDDEYKIDRNDPSYMSARQRVDMMYPNLDVNVFEFIGMLKIASPESKIEFKNSRKEFEVLKLLIKDKDATRILSFNLKGTIISDNKYNKDVDFGSKETGQGE